MTKDKYIKDISKKILCKKDKKAEIIKQKYNCQIDSSCYLLDDYTKNLREWERAGGIGIKRITSVADNSRGLWKGLMIKNLVELAGVIS